MDDENIPTNKSMRTSPQLTFTNAFRNNNVVLNPQNVIYDEADNKTRNFIMNGGKQLSFMTVCSDILDNSAYLNLDFLREDSHPS